MSHSLRIALLHPDLGIGGAERLVVDAALQLQATGHHVILFTTHHDRTRCFDETRDGTLTVRVYGDFFPTQVRGRLLALWAIVRMAYLTCAVVLRHGPFDVIFCDLVAHTIPILRRFSTARVVFYCHFPDQLLAQTRRGWYRWYRAPIDRLEELATGMADRVLVNSRFTAEVFRKTFPRLSLAPEVLSPGVNCAAYDAVATMQSRQDDILLLSINRYERKKNITLALEALALARIQLEPHLFAKVRLVIAGGYDERLQDNRDTFRALQARASELGLTGQVVFLRSVSTQERFALLAQCRAVVYTPENEHFGYVPLEAMEAGRPVVAVNSGGPHETIRHGETGLLCEPTPAAFAEALRQLIMDRDAAQRMGQAGRTHVTRHFSQAIFGSRLNQIVNELLAPSPAPTGDRCSAH